MILYHKSKESNTFSTGLWGEIHALYVRGWKRTMVSQQGKTSHKLSWEVKSDEYTYDENATTGAPNEYQVLNNNFSRNETTLRKHTAWNG